MMEKRDVFCKLSLVGLLLLVFGFITVYSSDPLDVPDDTLSCPDGWVKIHRGCYKFETTGRSWEEAKDECKAARGELTSIQSAREKEELEKHLKTHFSTYARWWVGFSRKEKKGTDWRWMDDTPVSTPITPWLVARMAGRPGNMCGMLEMQSGVANPLHISVTRCSSTQPYICEFHTITPRPSTSKPPKTTTLAPRLEDVQDTSSIDQPFVSCEDCPCPHAEKIHADKMDKSSPDESDLLGESLLKKRNYEALNTGDALYRRYLQSEIDANNAKVAYYDEVSKLYAEALEAQSQYYSSYQTKVDLEIAQLREGSKCT